MSVKQLKSVDISSYTIIATGISVLASVILAIIMVVGIGVLVPNSFAIIGYLIPTIIFGAMICSIFIYFSESYLYNILTVKLKGISFDIDDEGCIKSISTTQTAVVVAIISLILSIVVYLALSFLLPIILSSVIQTLMFTGQSAVAYSLYQILIVASNPVTIAIGIIGFFIINFVFTLLGTYIYNILGSSERGVKVTLSKVDNLTILESIDSVSLGVASGTIALILNIIVGVIMIISGYEVFNALTTILGGFAGVFIGTILLAIFYNLLAPRLGKLKIELIDI